MKWQKWTRVFIVAVVVLIAVWDVFVMVDGGTESSISHEMIVWAYKYPAFPFIMGFVMGHLFWRMGETKETAKVTGREKE